MNAKTGLYSLFLLQRNPGGVQSESTSELLRTFSIGNFVLSIL